VSDFNPICRGMSNPEPDFVPQRGCRSRLNPLFSRYFPDKPPPSCGTVPLAWRLVPVGGAGGEGEKRMVTYYSSKFWYQGEFRGKEGEGQKGRDG